MPYGGWNNCVQIANGLVDLVVTLDVGPRIIRYGFMNRVNELCEVESTRGLTGGDEWRIYGGHRLWHSPESSPRTYEADNRPVGWEELPDGIRTVQEVEPRTGIQKEMEIRLSSGDSRVWVLHRLTNTGPWPVKLAVWSITAMATGGTEVIPFAGRDTGLLPNRSLSIWPYTRMNDPRLQWGTNYLILKQDPATAHPCKVGMPNESGWAAYFNHGHLFVKYYTHLRSEPYPDLGASYETYTNDFMLEMESLSPLRLLEPGEGAEHTEEWELFDAVLVPPDEGGIDTILTGKIRRG